MKKHLIKQSIIMGLLVMGLFQSCTDEQADDPDLDPREKFIGTWSVLEESQGAVQNYASNVSNDPANSSRILIGNIFNLGEPIPAVVSGNSITLVNTTVSGFEIKGTGVYSGGGFVLNYTSNEGSGAVPVKATYKK